MFPMLIALVQVFVRGDRARTYLTVAGALLIACGSIFCAVEFTGAQLQIALDPALTSGIGYVTLAIDVLLCVYIIGKGVRHKKYLAVLLAVVQLVLAVYIDLVVMEHVSVAASLSIDTLSVIMALIIGIVGSGIVVYALGYMRVHEAHAAGPDRRNVFFAVMFAFLGAMFAIVFANELTWMLCAWEITTVCSFALIGYTRTEEATRNSFLQIVLNLVGGIAFSAALVWVGLLYGVNEFTAFIELSLSFAQAGYSTLVYIPVLLLALAGFTKAAQMPFQNWLLGAMVAPTPTSALLHSSTMVKAGVFLLIKLSPLLGFTLPGYAVMLVGGVTFLFCALAAISQSNAKRVLAYSTISNLGLITACAGVGTAGAVWAAIFLMIFHAVAKSLMFLAVGTAEHHIGSRDIEDMDDLFERMPRLARLMAIGILGMFIAPFGMLVSKWAALQSFAASENVILLLLLVFGSAATFMFWAKWLGKILAIANDGSEDVELTVSAPEWAALGLMTVLTVGCCIAFPLVSSQVVAPYLATIFGEGASVLTGGDLWIMAVMALVVAVVFLGFSGATRKRVVPVYLAGRTVDPQARTFRDSFGKELVATQRNWYMDDLFGEGKMKLVGIVVTLVLLVGSFAFALQSAASGKELLSDTAVAQASYQTSLWQDGSAGFDVYLQYYEYYRSYYEQNADAFDEQLGIDSMGTFMDELYLEMSTSSSSDGTGEGE